MKTTHLIVLTFLFNCSAFAQIGAFDKAVDIGDPKIKGSSTYDSKNQTYTLKGGGENIWFNHDEFHFLYKNIKGDFILTANFELIGNEDGNGHRKTGWMIRETTEHDAVSINSCLHGDGLAVLQWRVMPGAYMRDPEEEIFFPKQYFGETIIQLERINNIVTMRIAHPGEPLEEMGSMSLPELNDEVLVGLYSLAHDPEDIQEARVWNVNMTTPIPPDWHPNPLVETLSHEGLTVPSKIEVIDINSRKRNVLRTSEDVMESPYFSADGETIVFGKDEKIVGINVSDGTPMDIDKPTKPKSGRSKFNYYSEGKFSTNQIWRKKSDGSEARQLTFDLEHARSPHVSPDGKWIAYIAYPHDSNPQIASSFQQVTLKLLPVDGGAPRTLCYFNGGKGSFDNYAWSPDSKSLVFVSFGK